MKLYYPHNFYIITEDLFRNESLQYSFAHPKIFLFVPSLLQAFFRKHNVVYVTACHGLATIDTYYESYAYACYCKSSGFPVDAIQIDEVTLTVVCYRYPSTLMKHLKKRGYSITNITSGLYYILKNGFIPTLLITIWDLPAREYAWITKIIPPKSIDNKQETIIYASNHYQNNWCTN